MTRLALICVMATGVPCAATAAADAEPATRLLAAVNAARAGARLGAVTREPRLAAAACAHALDLVRGGQLDHRGSDNSSLRDRLTRHGYAFSAAAENLAAGIADPEEAVTNWLESPGHRRNILMPDFRHAGAARVLGRRGAVWVLVLATPRETRRDAIALSPDEPIERHLSDMSVESDDKPVTCY